MFWHSGAVIFPFPGTGIATVSASFGLEKTTLGLEEMNENIDNTEHQGILQRETTLTAPSWLHMI